MGAEHWQVHSLLHNELLPGRARNLVPIKL